jgi:hypothetical protein
VGPVDLAETETPLAHRAHHLAGAIYGTILATTVVAASAGHPEDVARPMVLVLGTSVVFWMAHVYALGLAARMVARRPLHRTEIIGLARSEWPMLQSSWPILAVLALGGLGVISPARTMNVALAVGIGALFTYGFIIGRQEGLGWIKVLLNALAAGGFGVAVLVLKLVVH